MPVPSPVPQSPWDCLRHTPPRRRVFWTTQPEACGSDVLCGRTCSIPGLTYEDGADDGRTIVTTSWLQSLILNILNTRARNDLKCPTPAATYGHWSESYREDGLNIGSRFWNAAERSYVRVSDAVNAIGTAIESDLHKLVALKVATAVAVKAKYLGSSSVGVEIIVTSSVSDDVMINLAGAFVAGGWEWR